uniref:sec1 family domain-containing protein MIP3 n=1 Tax=Erigeron canadensis TaxID=72917 RepID=UPI001CB92553|nr:sec1 family domain-containing protein MIP3 [Erigeron canadensis]
MGSVNVINCCLDSITQISDQLKGAIIYLDAGSTQSFKFLGAFPLLLDLGVIGVCSLENMSSLHTAINWNRKIADPIKVVFFTCRLLSDAHRYILRCLTSLERVSHCTIYTSISEIGHSAYPDSPLGPDAYHEYQSLLVQDYEEFMKTNNSNINKVKKNLIPEDEGLLKLTSHEESIRMSPAFTSTKDMYDVDGTGQTEDVGKKMIANVHHFPLIVCPFSPKFFVLPSEGSIAEAYLSPEQESSISSGLPPLSTGTSHDGEDVPAGVALTAQFLYHLTSKMDLKLEIFSLGDLSRTVGKLITDMSSLYDVGRHKRSAGLLLIDRTADLLTPCCHGDSLVDRIISSVPRRTRSSSGSAKGLQTHRGNSPANILHAPLDVQIPLADVLREVQMTNVHLQETIEAFLDGWNSNDSATQIDTLVSLGNKQDGENRILSESELLSGSLISTESFNGALLLESILDRRTKDGNLLIKKWLKETLRKEKISVNSKTQPRLELQHMISALARNQMSFMQNKGIIQLAAATSYAMSERYRTKWDSFISAEKILSISAGDTSQSLSSQMCDIINKSSFVKTESSQGLFTIEDALLLTVIGYILAGENFPTSGSTGPFSWQEEHFLKEAIVDAILENPELAKLKFLHGLYDDLEANLKKKRDGGTKEEPSKALEADDFDDDQWDNWGEEDADANKSNDHVYSDMQLKLELRDRVDNLFKFLHKLANLKGNKGIREATLNWENSIGDDPYSKKGLLYKLLTRILNKYEVPGLEYHSSTVGRLFKSGFGRFGLGQAKPSLADQNVILVFVVGGMNAIEVVEVQEALSESGRPDIEVVLGGTTFLTPADMLDLLLGDSSYV